MYIFKNALRNLGRSKGRNILTMIITLVITISACITLCIRQSAEAAKDASLESLEITAQISVNRMSFMQQPSENGEEIDRDAMRESLQGMTGLDLETLMTYATSKYVEDFYYTLTVSFNGNDELEAVNASSSDSTTNDMQMGGMQITGSDNRGGMGNMGTQGDFSLVGYSSHNAMSDFISGVSSIVDGVVFDETSEENQCIINEELATYNSLSVGDTITLVNPNNEEETFTFTICGIYSTQSSSSGNDFMASFNAAADPANQIYTNYVSLASLVQTSTEATEEDTALMGQESGTYVFNTVSDYEYFQEDVESMGLDLETYTISSSDLTAYENSLVPLENLSTYATYFFMVVLAIGAIILVVFNIFATRERKYEIGVLSAIGMNKLKVASQFVIESLVIAMVAVIIGIGVGATASKPIADTLLADQIEAASQSTQNMQNNFGGAFNGSSFNSTQMGGNTPNTITNIDTSTNYVDEITVEINMELLIQLALVGLLITLFSSITAVVFILRYDPLKILSERS